MNERMLVTHTGDTPRWQMIQEEMKTPAEDEVQIRVAYAGIANADFMMMRGKYPKETKVPFTPGYDITGEVIACGSHVLDISIGTKVAALTETGGYTTYINLPVEEVIVLPDDSDLQKMSPLMLNYVTAYQMMFRKAELKAGDQTLIQGAAGGVGTALIQLCNYYNIQPIGTGSPEQKETIEAMGADYISYEASLKHGFKQLYVSGVDAVFDHVGSKNWKKELEILEEDGRLIIFGFRHGSLATNILSYIRLKLGSRRDQVTYYFIAKEKSEAPETFYHDVKKLSELQHRGAIDPVIDRIYKLQNIGQALDYFQKHGKQGKVLLAPNSES
ncbi:NADPH2:quinone reductase [Salsuginibacillus halophilus]|uniref:NADPH2:quinone reductase n=1 Tax=Salsuginibacillus halophilus TaxID=517424 RepID=A0A2P8HLI6_9BACI|nr:zinc-binding dehydrogenase [Salsuginibacillus halophilus]PSL47088.1 NADPH2:quinone reductase [Salsuginibacillus halophilus]